MVRDNVNAAPIQPEPMVHRGDLFYSGKLDVPTIRFRVAIDFQPEPSDTADTLPHFARFGLLTTFGNDETEKALLREFLSEFAPNYPPIDVTFLEAHKFVGTRDINHELRIEGTGDMTQRISNVHLTRCFNREALLGKVDGAESLGTRKAVLTVRGSHRSHRSLVVHVTDFPRFYAWEQGGAPPTSRFWPGETPQDPEV